ncbi:hypothetical protein L3Y34_006569 [Caenorhabditis briggsae]|uniref:Serpentine receptor class gamma n=1 Tax=Caenorhabditis briggsae TaxID=6238 RepID=A0AAE8ZY17_CAEBR|nr:hypothetical protein L3Y34_006569 [Caenorhabditis briggsae]
MVLSYTKQYFDWIEERGNTGQVPEQNLPDASIGMVTRPEDRMIIIIYVIISIAGAMGMIITSKIKRIYLMFFGFVDVIPNCMSQDNEGFQVSINRFFNAFSFGSVICYLVLFKHLIKENKTVFNVSILRKRTKNRVFYHLLITAVLYLIVNSLHEALIYGFTLFDDTFVKTPFGAVAMMKV